MLPLNHSRPQVFFCTASTTPLTFRKANLHDINDSEMRRRLFGALHTLEIPQPAVFEGENTTEISSEFKRADWVLTDAKNPLGAWQDADALHHWHRTSAPFSPCSELTAR